MDRSAPQIFTHAIYFTIPLKGITNLMKRVSVYFFSSGITKYQNNLLVHPVACHDLSRKTWEDGRPECIKAPHFTANGASVGELDIILILMEPFFIVLYTLSSRLTTSFQHSNVVVVTSERSIDVETTFKRRYDLFIVPCTQTTFF